MLRVVGRFQRLVGFDRSMALASTSLTAVIALAILCGPALSALGEADAADRIIARYSLTGGGAEAVRMLFTAGEEPSTTILSALFLLLAVLSFIRTVQRFFEQNWELKPLSVRNTPNALLSALTMTGYLVLAAWLRTATGDWGRFGAVSAALVAPLTIGLLLLFGRLLSGRRIPWTDLLPFAVAAAFAEGAYSVGATVYLPRYFSNSASRYGPIGAVFAMISTLFIIMIILVASGALGREVTLELARIRRGERPPDGEVRQEWDSLRAEISERWEATRRHLPGRRPPDPPAPDPPPKS